jgi:hypothetical protein
MPGGSNKLIAKPARNYIATTGIVPSCKTYEPASEILAFSKLNINNLHFCIPCFTSIQMLSTQQINPKSVTHRITPASDFY